MRKIVPAILAAALMSAVPLPGGGSCAEDKSGQAATKRKSGTGESKDEAAGVSKEESGKRPDATAVAPPIGAEQVLHLVRSTLQTLNDANRSGNYTVLRDLAAPGFQAANTAADLAAIFSNLRQRRFDLGGASVLVPKLSEAPQLDANRMLRLSGHFETWPKRIAFDLTYQAINGEWRLFGISVATPDAPAAAAGK